MMFNYTVWWNRRQKRLGQWRDFFPLWPREIVTDEGLKIVWLETIQRRLDFVPQLAMWHPEYRLKPRSTDTTSSRNEG